MLFKLFCVFSLVVLFSFETEDVDRDRACTASAQTNCVQLERGYQLYQSYRRYFTELGVFFVSFELLRHCESGVDGVPRFLQRCLPLLRR
jgi:hypothetical protein